LGHYTWVVDEIMVEEVDSAVEASQYKKPFDTDNNEKGLQPATFTNEFSDEFVSLVGYCVGSSFVPPNLEVIRGQLNSNSKKIIKRLRRRMLKMYSHANLTNAVTSSYLPTIPVQAQFEPEDEII